jgi:hypothetical protein
MVSFRPATTASGNEQNTQGIRIIEKFIVMTWLCESFLVPTVPHDCVV